MKNILKNKKCLVTGATRGIGKQIAIALKKEGCKVLGVGRKEGDLGEYSGLIDIVDLVRNKLGKVDILINCAGVFIPNSLEASDLWQYLHTFNINVKAPWVLCKEFVDDMKKNKWGRIVNIGSISSYQGTPNTALYCASKHALLGLSRSLRGELKPYNIRVYCISPSGTKTDMGKTIPKENYDTFLNPKEIAEYVVFCLKFDKELISEEIRLNRFNREKKKK